MRRGFPYGTSITCKKEGKIYVESQILRSVTMSRDTRRGAHLLLQIRTRVLDDTLLSTFRRWYPGMEAGESPQEPALAAS